MNKTLIAGLALLAGTFIGTDALARPIQYTLRTVSDGQLGTWNFTEAEVIFTFVSDTRYATVSTAGGATVYSNSEGIASVTVTQGARTQTARFKAGEVYVRYDVTNGVVSFGSPISPTYPISLGCGLDNCINGGSVAYGIISALANAAAGDPTLDISTAAANLPADLSHPTLLTGSTTACAVAYVAAGTTGNEVCAGPAPRGLQTTESRVTFYLQDVWGSSTYQGCCGPSDYRDNVGAFKAELISDD